jgi:tetratricopeptide (TPR) repeat protein
MKRFLFVVGLILTSTLISVFAVEPLLKDAMDLAKDRKYDQAIEVVQKVLQTATPEQVKECHLTLGLLYYKAARYDNSLSEFSAIIAQDDKNVMAWFYMGYIYEQLAVRENGAPLIKEDTKKALDCWRKVAAYVTDSASVTAVHHKIDPKELLQRSQKHIKLLSEGLSEGLSDDK